MVDHLDERGVGQPHPGAAAGRTGRHGLGDRRTGPLERGHVVGYRVDEQREGGGAGGLTGSARVADQEHVPDDGQLDPGVGHRHAGIAGGPQHRLVQGDGVVQLVGVDRDAGEQARRGLGRRVGLGPEPALGNGHDRTVATRVRRRPRPQPRPNHVSQSVDASGSAELSD